ncbi:hypothetical protein GCM10008943_33900 [Paenochrobactrum glaciei]|uniref:Uncharacterized protein n=1 Tax=Paenochrobactrum glaciei TaxID=486407 RepID=A0ABN1GQ98_9HYPH
MRVYRLDPNTRSKQYPITQDGCFVLANPEHGNERHYAKNKVLVHTEQEMIDLIIQGYSVRVGTDKAPSLVRRNIFIDGEQVT